MYSGHAVAAILWGSPKGGDGGLDRESDGLTSTKGLTMRVNENYCDLDHFCNDPATCKFNRDQDERTAQGYDLREVIHPRGKCDCAQPTCPECEQQPDPLPSNCPRCDAPTEPNAGVCYVCELDLDDFFEREPQTGATGYSLCDTDDDEFDDDFCTICGLTRTECEERL